MDALEFVIAGAALVAIIALVAAFVFVDFRLWNGLAGWRRSRRPPR